MEKIEIARIYRSKRKSIALVVQPDGNLVVRAPLQTSNADIRRAVEAKAEWIQHAQAELRSRNQRHVKKEFTNGSEFWYLGQLHKLRIIEGQKHSLNLNGDFLLSQTVLSKAPAIFELWYKRQAHEIIHQRLAIYTTNHDFQYQNVRISSARTRWGSCSSRGTLSFSWRLVMTPLSVLDYVVVHELVHLKVPNHSQVFWDSVSAILPDYRERRAWLKENERNLTWEYHLSRSNNPILPQTS